ncbi:MAG TPA: heavy metal-binding domain-containing protein [Streptosporangiaceae bacterium]|nr:heavy metal-binding domain-containing protein [Streptosporangiaceae bacterium]
MWGSALSTDEFAAIKSVGFEPVGQVLGAAVYNVGFPGGYTCPTYGSRGAEAVMDFNRSRGYGPPVSYTHVSGSGGASAYGPLVNTLYAARRKAIARMSAQCQTLGGHGVVGVSLTIGRFPGGGVEFNAIGTAVMAPGGVRLDAPFTSAVSGQEFAKLIMAGLVPVALVLGISIGVRHDDWLMRGQTRWVMGNVEVAAYTQLVNRTRQDARNELHLDVGRVSADGVVIERTEMHIGEAECRGKERARDYRAEVTMLGTAISQFSRSRSHQEQPSLAVLSLDPERRSKARAGAGTMGRGPSLSVLLAERHDSQGENRDGEQEQ